ncbi:MAG: acyl-CoA/acyl-ACP dehydrogenase [Proteobacteria bacterium]|nr:acyl-CoA/acyl-ACP dehydrogenase [Pseudomonadota bacterium]
MGYALSEEQRDLRDTVRRFCEDKSPMTEVRRLMETPEGFDEAVWEQMAGELGLQGVAIPEQCGGHGLGFVEQGLVMAELGRALFCAPYFSSAVLAAGTLRHVASDTERNELLPGIAGGVRATLALSEPDAGGSLEHVALRAVPDGEGFRLSGIKSPVIDGASAEHLAVVARVPDGGLGLFWVEADSDGLERALLQSLDRTRKQARLEFRDTPARALGEPGQAQAPLERALDEAAVALACEMVGGCEMALETAVAYAKGRVQFGRPIGSFQAIKHKCADMWIELEAARSAARFAAAALDEGAAEAGELACVAKARAAEAFVSVATENIQIHGGVGFTWEYDAHLFYRRAKTCDILLGDASVWRERLIRRLAG